MIGRLWCGWACPQTVFLEGIFRRVERFIDGPGHERLALDKGPWTARKLWKRSLKWSVWIAVALVLSHTGLAYFTGAHELVTYITNGPLAHPGLASFAAAGTVAILFDMTWFREQMCLIVCPYGRLQSVLTDEDTFVIGYDKARGEPRGKASDANAGACVDCRRCVVVCPTGIDIRNGLQLDCIGCAQCADACDLVMEKLHRPKGLIRTDSLRGFAGEKRRFLRPRLLGYAIAGLVGAMVAGFVVGRRVEVEANIVRAPGPPFVVAADGRVTNALMLHGGGAQAQRQAAGGALRDGAAAVVAQARGDAHHPARGVSPPRHAHRWRADGGRGQVRHHRA
jgi:cytochrome c oxidase accessory protein FixG